MTNVTYEHDWLCSLKARSALSKVALDGQASDPVSVQTVVYLGSISGPVLFLIFINDLSDHIRSSVCLFAVADDCLLYSNIIPLTDIQTLHIHVGGSGVRL